jgi:hypothetical protein
MTLEDPHHIRMAGHVVVQVAPERWQAAPYRCPCGFIGDDADEFGRHLDAAEDAEPEHFEVLDGWTLQQVRQWQATDVTSPEARVTARAARAS